MYSNEAWDIVNSYHRSSGTTEEDEFRYVEALKFLIAQNAPQTVEAQVGMYNLGAYYYHKEEYTLALKYYQMAVEAGEIMAAYHVGVIFFYGLAGETDYEKAFYSFMKDPIGASATLSQVMLAVMYRDGLYVSRDYQMYKAIIEEMYTSINISYQTVARPYVFFHMAEVWNSEGKTASAIRLYKTAKKELNDTISGHPVHEELVMMRQIIHSLHSMKAVSRSEFDFFDLYEILTVPCEVSFRLEGQEYRIQAQPENKSVSIHFVGRWYRSAEEFLRHAWIGERKLLAIRDKIMEICIIS